MFELLVLALHTQEKESTLLTRSFFALKESIMFLDSYHQVGFIEPEQQETMKLLTRLEEIHNAFESLMIQDTGEK